MPRPSGVPAGVGSSRFTFVPGASRDRDVRARVSCARSASNPSASIASAVRQTPLTATESPSVKRRASDGAETLIRVVPARGSTCTTCPDLCNQPREHLFSVTQPGATVRHTHLPIASATTRIGGFAPRFRNCFADFAHPTLYACPFRRRITPTWNARWSLRAPRWGWHRPIRRWAASLAHGNIIAGEGAHRYDARDHAEIVALKQAGESAVGATAYVTLEPCAHHGRTGPCANALIDAGVTRVVTATLDPNPHVAGQGMARIVQAGVTAEDGLLQPAARAINDAFARHILTGFPLVTLKSALSVDGRLAPLPIHRPAGSPFWLTGTAAREEVHRFRHANDAIITGIGTVLADDPILSDRSNLPRRRRLLRVVLDTKCRMPIGSRLVKAPTTT